VGRRLSATDYAGRTKKRTAANGVWRGGTAKWQVPRRPPRRRPQRRLRQGRPPRGPSRFLRRDGHVVAVWCQTTQVLSPATRSTRPSPLVGAQNVQVVVLNVAGSSSVTRPKGNARLTAYIRSAQPGGTLRGIEIGTILSNECGKQSRPAQVDEAWRCRLSADCARRLCASRVRTRPPPPRSRLRRRRHRPLATGRGRLKAQVGRGHCD
jgi:hypothetical protein